MITQQRSPRHVAFAAGGLALAALLGLPGIAHADRADTLLAGPELRVRPRPGSGARYELALPNGLASADGRTAFLFRLGALLPGPAEGAPLAFPLTAGMRWAPWAARVRPVLGSDVGGYLVLARGPRANQSPNGPEWIWSARALLGLATRLGGPVSLLVYADGMLVQVPQDARSRPHLVRGLGAGVELQVAFAPRLRFVDMVLHGTAAPKGF